MLAFDLSDTLNVISTFQVDVHVILILRFEGFFWSRFHLVFGFF